MYRKLFRQVDNSILIAYRILFGLLLSCEAIADILSGRVRYTFMEPRFTFTFIGFEWLQPLPGNGMYYYYAALAILGIMIAIGLFYRFSIILYALLWAACYFMQKENYNNHYYLILLLCSIMVFLPAQRYASVDVMHKPSLKQLHCAQWIYWLFIAQMGIVYFFGAVNKIYPDWLSGQYISILFRSKGHIPIIGPLYSLKWFQLFICYGGLLFDLLVTPLLLFRPTRKPAFYVCCFFHVFNAITFNIGIFPFLAIATTIFFFPPDVIRSLFFLKKEYYAPGAIERGRYAPAVIIALAIYITVQVLLPLRAFVYPGNPNWTEEGHRLSWRMMLRTKQGSIVFSVQDVATAKSWIVKPEQLLTRKQADKMAVCPDMIWQVVQRLKKDYALQGYSHVQIYALSSVSLNGRPTQPLIDPGVDMAAIKWSWYRHSDWVTDLRP